MNGLKVSGLGLLGVFGVLIIFYIVLVLLGRFLPMVDVLSLYGPYSALAFIAFAPLWSLLWFACQSGFS